MTAMEKLQWPEWVDTGPTPLLKAVGRDRRNQTYAARPSRDYYNEIIPNRTEVQMRNVIGALCLAIACSSALAADTKKEPSEKQKAQQERMTECNAKAGHLTGSGRFWAVFGHG